MIKNRIKAIFSLKRFKFTYKNGGWRKKNLWSHRMRVGGGRKVLLRQLKLGGGMVLLILWGCSAAATVEEPSRPIPFVVYMTEIYQRSLTETTIEIYIADVAGSNEYMLLDQLGIRSYYRTISGGRAGDLSTVTTNFEFSRDCRLYEGVFYLLIFNQRTNNASCATTHFGIPNIYASSAGRSGSFDEDCVLFELYQNVEDVRRTIDFIHLGRGCSASQSSPVPVYATAAARWVGEASAVAIPSTGGTRSMVRRLGSFREGVRGFHYDENTFSIANWRAGERSLRLPSDASCASVNSADDDGDGIYDCLETLGSTYFGMPLYNWGARRGQKDIFLEIDYMACTISGNTGSQPMREVLVKVVRELAKIGYRLHVDVGNLYHSAPGTAVASYDLGGGNNYLTNAGQRESYYGISLDSNANLRGAQLYRNLKATNFRFERKQLFYYMVIAETMNPQGFISGGVTLGMAEIPGNDALITLNSIGVLADRSCDVRAAGVSRSFRNRIQNIQAYTILHEIGHNLGLYHGGADPTNFKPNYASVMNYAYLNHGTPTVMDPTPVSNAYYYNNYRQSNDGGLPECYIANGINEGFNPDMERQSINIFTQELVDFSLTFSAGTNALINEGFLDERVPIMGNIRIDYNCDGDVEDVLTRQNINFDTINTNTNTTNTNTTNFAPIISDLRDYDDKTHARPFHANVINVLSLRAAPGDERSYGVRQMITSDEQPVVAYNEEPVFNVNDDYPHDHLHHSEANSSGHDSMHSSHSSTIWGKIKAWISRYFSHKN